MSAPTGPVRHDIMFSMSDASKARVDGLLRQCGHTNLNLLLARGLALVQWVEDHQSEGRCIAALTCGDDIPDDVIELEERPELLKPQRPQSITAPAKPVEPVQEPSPAPVVETTPAPEPAARAVPAINPDKLKARPKTPPPVKQPKYRAPSGREQALRAHIPNDNGPVKSRRWVEWKCESEGRVPPIYIGDDRVLPGELTLDHLPELERIQSDARHATHFLVTKEGALFFYGFTPGNGKRGGWCYLEDDSMRLLPEGNCNAGLFAIFPVVMAVEYLRRLASPARAMAVV